MAFIHSQMERPGAAMRLHGAGAGQIVNLIHRSAARIEARRYSRVCWPWPSPGHHWRRLDDCQRLIADFLELPPLTESLLDAAGPFRPCEIHFAFACHQERRDFLLSKAERAARAEAGLDWPCSPARDAVRKHLGETAQSILPWMCNALIERLDSNEHLVWCWPWPGPLEFPWNDRGELARFCFEATGEASAGLIELFLEMGDGC